MSRPPCASNHAAKRRRGRRPTDRLHIALHFSFGSIASLSSRPRHVRLSSDSGKIAASQRTDVEGQFQSSSHSARTDNRCSFVPELPPDLPAPAAALNIAFAEHNAGKSQHTSKYVAWKLVTYVAFSDEQKAETFERYLKSGAGHAFAREKALVG